MQPFFTSRTEWHSAAVAGERTYVLEATGYVVRGGLLGLLALVGPAPWIRIERSLPLLALFAASLAAGAGLGALLFRREWRAAACTYGMPAMFDGARSRAD